MTAFHLCLHQCPAGAGAPIVSTGGCLGVRSMCAEGRQTLLREASRRSRPIRDMDDDKFFDEMEEEAEEAAGALIADAKAAAEAVAAGPAAPAPAPAPAAAAKATVPLSAATADVAGAGARSAGADSDEEPSSSNGDAAEDGGRRSKRVRRGAERDSLPPMSAPVSGRGRRTDSVDRWVCGCANSVRRGAVRDSFPLLSAPVSGRGK